MKGSSPLPLWGLFDQSCRQRRRLRAGGVRKANFLENNSKDTPFTVEWSLLTQALEKMRLHDSSQI